MRGILVRDYVKDFAPEKAASRFIDGVVLNVKWRDLQPFGRGTFSPPVSDMPLPTRLRVLGGVEAPPWVKDTCGRIPWSDGVDLPNMWRNRYVNLWRELQLWLKAWAPENVVEIVMTGGSTVYGEPFIRQSSQGTPLPSYEDDLALLTQMVNTHNAVWPDHDHIISVFPWQYASSVTGQNAKDLNGAMEIAAWGDMDTMVNDLRHPLTPAARKDRYERLYTAGRFASAQLAAREKVGNWHTAAVQGYEYWGLTSVELAADYAAYDYGELADVWEGYQA